MDRWYRPAKYSSDQFTDSCQMCKSDLFRRYKVFLNLMPFLCSKFLLTGYRLNPICSHRSSGRAVAVCTLAKHIVQCDLDRGHDRVAVIGRLDARFPGAK